MCPRRRFRIRLERVGRGQDRVALAGERLLVGLHLVETFLEQLDALVEIRQRLLDDVVDRLADRLGNLAGAFEGGARVLERLFGLLARFFAQLAGTLQKRAGAIAQLAHGVVGGVPGFGALGLAVLVRLRVGLRHHGFVVAACNEGGKRNAGRGEQDGSCYVHRIPCHSVGCARCLCRDFMTKTCNQPMGCRVRPENGFGVDRDHCAWLSATGTAPRWSAGRCMSICGMPSSTYSSDVGAKPNDR